MAFPNLKTDADRKKASNLLRGYRHVITSYKKRLKSSTSAEREIILACLLHAQSSLEGARHALYTMFST